MNPVPRSRKGIGEGLTQHPVRVNAALLRYSLAWVSLFPPRSLKEGGMAIEAASSPERELPRAARRPLLRPPSLASAVSVS